MEPAPKPPSFDAEAPTLDWDSDEEQGSRPAGAKKGLKSSSVKQKGRRLQQWCAGRYLAAFSDDLDSGDVVSRSMGAAGSDLMLSPKAREILPYDFECKNTEKLSLWATIEQSQTRVTKENECMCAIVKRNRMQPVVILPWGEFLNLVRVTIHPIPAVNDPKPTPARLLSALGMPLRHSPVGDLISSAIASLKFAAMDPGEKVDIVQGVKLKGVDLLWWKYRFRVVCAKSMAFYTLWDELWEGSKKGKLHTPAILFNRKDSGAPMYVALPFDAHLEFLRTRWETIQAERIRQTHIHLGDPCLSENQPRHQEQHGNP